MTTQAWQSGYGKGVTEEDIEEAIELSKGLDFKTERHCCDGYESWTSTVTDYSQIAELIKRVRKNERI